MTHMERAAFLSSVATMCFVLLLVSTVVFGPVGPVCLLLGAAIALLTDLR